MGGAKDGAIGIARYAVARRGFSGPYEFMPFANSGHFPEMEEAERFNDAILRFLGPPSP